MKKLLSYLVVLTVALTAISLPSRAQFKEDAFTQTYNEKGDTLNVKDTSDQLFSFKELFGGLSHKREARIGVVFAGSLFMPGSFQIYNEQYWKLPIVYSGLAAFGAAGGYYRYQYDHGVKLHKQWETSFKEWESLRIEYETLNSGMTYTEAAPVEHMIDARSKTISTWLFVGMGLWYWGSLMDGVTCYKRDVQPHPGRATLYSLLLPGLGQCYNGEYWKVPVYWGLLAGGIHFWTTNQTNYKRYQRIYKEAGAEGSTYTGSISAETAKYYRDSYRRFRDYSVLATCAFYLLQVIDANVFAFMYDFEVNDDISLQMAPTLITPESSYAVAQPKAWSPRPYNMAPGVGLRVNF
ncbi:MAG: DUF5683 domain-containing protein [Bacteroidales bacterium]|nr:DUF5683 domain-containing protein [Bacteroidales bacterium]